MGADLLRLFSESVETTRSQGRHRLRLPCRLCGAPSRDQVPACLKHIVDVMPYAAKVEAELGARIDETEALLRGGKPKPRGRLADEILEMLELGPLSVGQASRLLLGKNTEESRALKAAKSDAVLRLAKSMERAGRITLARRGKVTEMRRAET